MQESWTLNALLLKLTEIWKRQQNFFVKKGIAKAAKKADRVAAEGLTGIAVNGNVAAIVELNSETDFVAKNDQFVALVKETAELIASKKPATNEEALALETASGITLEAELVQATATIGEKNYFPSFCSN